MEERQYAYAIFINDDAVAVADTIDIALIIVGALFDKWFRDPDLKISIKRRDYKVEAVEENDTIVKVDTGG